MKKKIIFLSIFILVLILGGVGIYYFTQSHKDAVTFADTEAKYKTYTEQMPSDGSLPTDHDSYSNIAYVLWNIEHTENYSSMTRGTAVSVGQKQTIYNHRVVNGDVQLVDTVSGGLITLGKQKYFKDGKVLLRDYISQDGDQITWKTDEPECITNAGYIKRYGWLPSQSTAYIICKETILDISDVTCLDNGLYKIHLSLNPDREYAPFWYRREIATNSSSLIEPIFSSIEIDYIFDANWRCMEVCSQETYTVKPKVAPISVDCTTDITETFDYENYTMDEDALGFFKQYESMQPSDGEVELPADDTALSYITGSLMGGDSEKTFDLVLTLDDQTIKGEVALNISDLNDIIVKLKMDSLNLVYEHQTVYLSYGQTRIKGNVQEMEEVLTPLLRQIILGKNSNPSSGGVAVSLDLNQIMNNINQAKVEKNDTKVNISFDLNLGPICLPILFDMDSTGVAYNLNFIHASLPIGDSKLQIELNQNKDIQFEEVEDASYQNVKNIQFICEDLTTILQQKRVGLDFSFQINNQPVSGSLFLDFEQKLALQADILWNQEKISLTYLNDVFYIQYQNQKVKLSKEKLLEFLNNKVTLPSVPAEELSILQVVEQLKTIDFEKLLQKLSFEESKLEMVLNLTDLLPELGNFSLLLEDTEQGFVCSSNVLDFSIAVHTDITTTIEVEEDYTDLHAYVDVADYLYQLLQQKSIGISVTGTILALPFDGTIQLYWTGTHYEAAMTFELTYQNQPIQIQILMFEEEIYLQCFNQTIQLKKEHLLDTLNRLMNKMDVTMPTLDTSTSSMNLEQLTIGEQDLSILLAELGEFKIHFDLNEVLMVSLQLASYGNIELSIHEIESVALERPTTYLDEKQLSTLLDLADDVLFIIEQQSGYISFSMKDQLSGEVYLNWQNGFQARMNLMVNQTPVTIYLLGQEIYLNYQDQIKLKLNIEDLKRLIPESNGNNGATLEGNNIVELLQELLSNIQIEQNKVTWLMQVAELPSILLELIKTEVGFDLNISPYDLHISIDRNQTLDCTLDQTDYVEGQFYIELVEYLMNRIGKKSMQLSFDGTYHCMIDQQELPVSWTGTADLIYRKDSYDLMLTALIEVQNIQLPIEIWLIGQELSIRVMNQVVQLSLTELPELLQQVTSKLGIQASSSEQPDILSILSGLTIQEQSISLNLNDLMTILVSLAIDEVGLHANLTTQNLTCDITLLDGTAQQLAVPTATITKEEILYWMDTITYLKKHLYEQSFHIGIPNSQINIKKDGKEEQIGLQAAFDVVYQEEHSYALAGYIDITMFGHTEKVELVYKDQWFYVTILNNTFKLSFEQLLQLVEQVQTTYSITMPELPMPDSIQLDQLEMILGKQEWSLDLTSLVQQLLKLQIAFAWQEETFQFDTTIDLTGENWNANLAIVLSEAQQTMIIEPTGTILGYQDILEWMEQVHYLVELYQSGAIHVDLAPATIVLQLNDQPQECVVQGSFDVWCDPTQELMLNGSIDVTGFGLSMTIEVALIGQDLYLSMLGQTIYLPLGEWNTFVEALQQKLSGILTFNNPVDVNVDFSTIDLLLQRNGLDVSISNLTETMISLACWLDVVDNALNMKLDLNYTGIVSVTDLSVTVSHSEAVRIEAPTSFLTTDDILKLLDDVLVLYQLKDQKRFGLQFDTDIVKNHIKVAHIAGQLNLDLLENQEFDAHLDLYVDEFNDKGESTAWHQLHLMVLSATTRLRLGGTDEAIVFGTYGNMSTDQNQVLKIQSTYTGVQDLIASIQQLLGLDVVSNSILSGGVMNLNDLIPLLVVQENGLKLGIRAKNLFPNMTEDAVIQLQLDIQNGTLASVSADQLYVSYTNQFQSMQLDQLQVTFSDAIYDYVLPNLEEYRDISNISHLFEAFYHNAQERDFEVKGKVEFQALSVIKKDIDVLIQVHVEDNGEPTLYLQLGVPEITIPFMSKVTQKTVHLYYHDQYIYIYREDSKTTDSKQIKIHYTTFMDELVYYLLDFGMGLPDGILKEINGAESKGKGYVNAANCITDLQLQENTFRFGLNVGEIADNSNLGDLYCTIESAMVTKQDEAGNEIQVPMIHQITEFSFKLVSVINITLAKNSNLVLSNIVSSGDQLIVEQRDFTAIYQFVESYTHEEDKEYCYNGTEWVEGQQVVHHATFINEFVGEQTSQDYYKGDMVVFPTYDQILFLDNQYYQFSGWYYDAAFQVPVEDGYVMGNRSVTFYAKMDNITSEYEIVDDYGNTYPIMRTYLDQSLDVLYEEYSNKLITVDAVTMIFDHFEIQLQEEWIPFNDVTAKVGHSILKACYVEITYTAYLINEQRTITLSSISEEAVCEEAYLFMDGIYFGYLNATLSHKILLDQYLSYFNEDHQINIYTKVDTTSGSYHLLQMQFQESNVAYQNKTYNALAYCSGTDITSYLPNGETDLFEINAWIDETGRYYSANDLVQLEADLVVSPYITSKGSLFSYNGATIIGYLGDNTIQHVIVPRYYQNVLIETIGENAFKDKNDLVTVVLSEGITSIGQHAFQNAKGLKAVYLPSTLTTIANESFMYNYDSSFETCRDNNATQLKLYYIDERQNNQFGQLVACYANYLFGKKYAYYGEKTTGSWSADLSGTFTYSDKGASIAAISSVIVSGTY